MSDRLPPLPGELNRHGPWRCLEPLAGDASMRRYARLHGIGSETAIAVVYPANSEAVFLRDLEVRDWLATRGLRVPALLAVAASDGWALLEDFGPRDAATVLADATPAERTVALQRLIGPLAVLADLDPVSLPPWSTPLAHDRLRWELAGFELWYLRVRRALTPPSEVGVWLDDLAAECASVPRRVCHRDYHLNNLYLLDDGDVGVIDYQDVLVGPQPYDVVSLVGERDALALLSEMQRQEALRSWARRTAAAPSLDQRAAVVSAQRRLKVLGTFARLEESGRSGYTNWLHALERPTAETVAALGGPPVLVDLLLHSSRQGGPHVR